MASKSKIEWTEATWNPVVGCTKVSEGCKNCYAETMAKRLYWMGMSRPATLPEYTDFEEGWKNGHIELCEHRLNEPLHWRKPRRIFVCSMSDLFHEKVPFKFIEKVMATIEKCPQHTFQILTKRPHIMDEYFNGLGKRYELSNCPNLWLGVSCENQKAADERIPILMQIPAAVRSVSLEPLLGKVDLQNIDWDGATGLCTLDNPPYQIRWVIIGCESGPKRRLCKLEWVRSLVCQCKAASVPVFVKQLNLGGKVVRDINKFPADLQIRDYPQQITRKEVPMN